MEMPFALVALITLIVTTCAQPSRPGDKIHFQDSAELEQLDVDTRSGAQHRDRNHRGRAPVAQQPGNYLPQFEQGIPGLYPLKGPPQKPLLLPAKNYSDTTNNLVFATQPKQNTPVIQPQPTPKNYHYAANPFLSKLINDQSNKFSSIPMAGVTNQLPSSAKPFTTTTTTPNPRLTNLLYGSNLLEDASGGSRTETTTDVSFGDRGIFDTAPHCQPNEILVKTKCRPRV